MDDDDDFGDLYADVVASTSGGNDVFSARGRVEGKYDDDDDEELLYGTSSTGLGSGRAPATVSVVPQGGAALSTGFEVGGRELDNEENFLYGQLYGSSSVAPEAASDVFAQATADEGLGVPANKTRSEAAVIERADSREKDAGESQVENEESFLFGTAGGTGKTLFPARAELPPPKVATLERFGNPSLPQGNGATQGVALPAQVLSQGFDRSGSGGFYEDSEAAEQDDAEGVGTAMGGANGEEVDDWDSDSEDDLQIVLNDETPAYENLERGGDGEYFENSDEEDEEDLVIVAGDDEALEGGQEWGDEAALSEQLPGPPSGAPPPGTEKALSAGEDRVPLSKAGGSGASPGIPRIGYSGQGYHSQPHHGQYKYVRPGAATSGAPPSSQAGPTPPVAGGRGQSGGPSWGQGRGAGSGRGDWGGGGRGSYGAQRGGQSGTTPWTSGGRGYSNGIEFNLPPTKTAFDIDIDTLEDKPWRRSGVDPTDYFNFGFVESSWKQYCRQLAQLRFEATMQSKIRVYESGRSEQEYDPDLPPELLAAANQQDGAVEFGFSQQRQPDSGTQSGAGRGRGGGRGRVTMPTGRAIQVEGGGGERRPSADIRRQRTRDSDAVIQIVLQDAAEDELPAPTSTHHEEYMEDEVKGGQSMDHQRLYHMEDEPRDFRSGGPGPWMDFYPHPEPWESETMMGMGGGPMHPMNMRPGSRMGIDGPGPFPMGPGIPMGPPGPDFGMFPGGPFGVPPFERGGMGRPPMYGGPRPGMAPLPGLGLDGFPPEHFPPQIPPMDFPDPMSRRRSPLRMAPAIRGMPPHAEWEEEPSNGSGANWSGREPHSLHGSRERESHSHEYEAETRGPARRSRSNLPEKSVDETSVKRNSVDRKRSVSKEPSDDEDSEPGDNVRPSKRVKVVALKAGREESSHMKASKSVSSGESSSTSSSENSGHIDTRDDSSHHRRRQILSRRDVEKGSSPYNGLDGYHQQQADSGQRRQRQEAKERRRGHETENLQGHRGNDEPVYERRVREEGRERREREEVLHTRREKGRERETEARRQERVEHGYQNERDSTAWKREREDLRHRQRVDDNHGQKSRVDERSGRNERSRHGGGDNEAWSGRDVDRDHERIRARDESKPHDKEGSRLREDNARTDWDDDRLRDRSRRDDLRARDKDRAEEPRESEKRSQREDDLRARNERRRAEERSIRHESVRDRAVDGRKVDDIRLQKRAWDASGVKDVNVDRNGSLAGEKGYHTQSDRSRRNRNDDHYPSSHLDKEHILESGRIRDRKSILSRRLQETNRRGLDSEDVNPTHSMKDQKSSAAEAGSSEEEDERDQRGRTKFERWTSRKEREFPVSVQENEVRQRRHHGSKTITINAEDEPSTTQQHIDGQQGQTKDELQQAGEQTSKDERKERQRSSHVSIRHSDYKVGKESSRAEGAGSGTNIKKESKRLDSRDQIYRQSGRGELQDIEAAGITAAMLEKRKERFGRLRKPADNDKVNREEEHTSIAQADTVEVKQERPARKRRWAGSTG